MSQRTLRIVLIGIGNLGRRFAALLDEREDALREEFGLDLRIVGAADSNGAAVDSDGLAGREIARLKEAGKPIASFPEAGRPGMTGLQIIEAVDADVLCEASPVNVNAGAEPGLSHIRAALGRGMHVTTPNKGPILLAYRELTELARLKGVELRFDGTVAGGLPALYLGARDLRGAVIEAIESVPNLSTGYILDLLADGASWDEATERARADGVLEADPSWDLDGWDAAAKLAILSDAVLGFDATLDTIDTTGIREIDVDWVRRQRASGAGVRLVASARRRTGGTYDLCVAPTALPADHPLGRLGDKQMGIVYTTDIFGTITAIIDEPTPLPSAATMLRDLLDIVS